MIGFNDIEFASLTDVGVRRSHNQDAHVVVPATDRAQFQQAGHVFLVADGMGGHAVGELASKLAVDNIPHIFSKHATEGAADALRKAFIEANVTIHNRGKQNREFHRMGTTATALLLRPEGAWVAHVGDSRVYRIRGGQIEQLSFDHSMVWELARRQKKRPEELEGIASNIITRSLGPEPLVQIDVEGPHPIERGDVYLLCSDGLSGQVSDREIGAVVSTLAPAEACRFLIHLANLQGGPDNITAVIVRINGEPGTGSRDSAAELRLGSAFSRWTDRALPVLRSLPWSLVLLVIGLILSLGSIFLIYFQLSGGYPAFLLAGVSLLSGLGGLMLQNLRESRGEPQTPAARPLQVYRHASSVIDESLLQKFGRATAALEQNVREKGWQFDDALYRGHAAAVQSAADEGKLDDAFRAQCYAMLVLMEAVAHQRGREEAFKPLWDRVE